jgi:hypothetical protein
MDERAWEGASYQSRGNPCGRPVKVAPLISTRAVIRQQLNTIKARLGQMQVDARRLVGMDNTQLLQTNGLTLRSEMDAIATRITSGGNNPTTGEQEPGVARISDQIQQLATFDIKVYRQ